MRTGTLLTITTLTMALGFPGTAQTVIPLGHFESIGLQNGGHVLVRQGKTQRVTLIRGDLRTIRVAVHGQQLVIDNAHGSHRRGERLEIEVVTPELSAVSVSNGGTLETAGAFSAQPAIAATVEQGGTIDIRSVAADAVTASIESGGRIFTHPRQTLTASVRSGGGITWWGNPRVTRSIRDGGVVVKGTQANAGKPLSELDPGLAVIQPVPPVPPIPPSRRML